MTILTNEDFLKVGSKWPPDPDRIARYSRNKLLMEGHHDIVFLGLNEDDAPRIIKMRLNWFKRIMTVFADLATGNPPKFTATEQATIDRITEVNAYHQIIYDLIGDVIAYGDSVLKVRWNGARSVISRIDPKIWFPIVSPDDVNEVVAHVLAWEVKQKDDRYLKVEIHKPGKIIHKLLKLSSDGKEVREPAPLSTIERYAKLKEEEQTNVAGFLIFPFSNLKDGGGLFGLDDFRDITDLIEEIERRLIKVSSTLDVFADPWMAGPAGLRVKDPLTGEVIWASDERYIVLGEGETPPTILTWDAQMGATFSQIENLMQQLYVLAELSPAAFGETKNGLAESGSALKRLLLPTLAKVNRIRLRIKPGLLSVLVTAAELEVASRMTGGTLLTNASLEWRSSLPVDPMEAARIEATRRDAKAASTRSSLKRLDPDLSEEDIDAEVSRIEEEEGRQAQALL